MCSDAIKKLTTSIDMEEFMPHLDFIYNNMRSIISDAKFRYGVHTTMHTALVLSAQFTPCGATQPRHCLLETDGCASTNALFVQPWFHVRRS